MKKSPSMQKGVYLKNRIARTRSRAKFVGIIYLFATIALAAVGCLPLLVNSLAPVGVMEFWKVFLPENFKLDTVEAILRVANAAIYALMLLGLIVNVFKALSKLNWLFKRKASRTYGFNRNVYAMEDLGKIFSGSYAVLIVGYFLIALICGGYDVNKLMLIMLGGGLVIHILFGLIGGKASYFSSDDGEIVEQKREVGRFVPFLRNLFQIAATFFMMYVFLRINTIHSCIGPMLEVNGIANYVLPNIMGYISIALQLLAVIWLIVLVKHTVNTTEYNIEGPYAPGMKNYRVFSFFTFLTVGGIAVCRMLLGETTFTIDAAGKTFCEVVVYAGETLDIGSIVIAGVALFMFLFEVILRNRPKFPVDKSNEIEEATIAFVAQKSKTKKSEKKVEAQPQAPVATQQFQIPVSVQAPQCAATPCQPQFTFQIQTTPAAPQLHPDSPFKNLGVEETPTMDDVAEEMNVDVEEDFEDFLPYEEEAPLDVVCPNCGKALQVKESVPYHRCPTCSKVFQVRKVSNDVII